MIEPILYFSCTSPSLRCWHSVHWSIQLNSKLHASWFNTWGLYAPLVLPYRVSTDFAELVCSCHMIARELSCLGRNPMHIRLDNPYISLTGNPHWHLRLLQATITLHPLLLGFTEGRRPGGVGSSIRWLRRASSYPHCLSLIFLRVLTM